MKSKKGFTLIELLAVIIVLAIIALIATPIIFNVIENAKIKSLENSTYGVIDAIRTTYTENLLNSTRECEDENDKNCGGKIETSGDVSGITVSGEQPTGGSWVIVNDALAENGRGIQVTDVTFDSMKGYFCSNDLTTGKVKCEKDDANPTLEPIQATVEVGKGTDKKIEEYFTFAKTGRGASTLSCKDGNTQITNVNTLELGDHTIKCIATKTSNGKTSEEKQVTIKVIEKPLMLREAILGNNNSNVLESGDGLYSQTTDTGITYYFKGTVKNNYIKFADILFRIVRVNEDGTIRIITQNDVISGQKFKTDNNKIEYMYYTNSELKTVVEDWFTANITGDNANKVASGNYFCEQAKIVSSTGYTAGNATVATRNTYTPSFNCATDGNGKGVVNSNVGLITIDEFLYAGGVFGKRTNIYLINNNSYWTMSPAGVVSNGKYAYVWYISLAPNEIRTGALANDVRPVLNLNANTLVTGSGTSTDPYVVK